MPIDVPISPADLAKYIDFDMINQLVQQNVNEQIAALLGRNLFLTEKFFSEARGRR